MQPISGKELDYISDSLTNEELLLKQTAAAATAVANGGTRNLLLNQLHSHEQHIHTLLNVLQQQQQQTSAPQQAGQFAGGFQH